MTKDQITTFQHLAIFQLQLGFKRIDSILKAAAAGVPRSSTDLNTLSVVNYLSVTDFARIGEELFSSIRTQVDKLRKETYETSDSAAFTDKCKNHGDYYSYYCQIATLRNSILMQASIVYAAYGLHDINSGILQQIKWIKQYDLELLSPFHIVDGNTVFDNVFLHPAMWLSRKETEFISSYLTSIGFKCPITYPNPLIDNPLLVENQQMIYPRVLILSVQSGCYLGWDRLSSGSTIIPQPDSEKYNSGTQWALIRRDSGLFHIKRIAFGSPKVNGNGKHFLSWNAERNTATLDTEENCKEWGIELKEYEGRLYFYIYEKVDGHNYYICSNEGWAYFGCSKTDDPKGWERLEITIV